MAIFNVPKRLSHSTSSRPIVVFIAYSCPKAKRHNQIQTDIVDGRMPVPFSTVLMTAFGSEEGELYHPMPKPTRGRRGEQTG